LIEVWRRNYFCIVFSHFNWSR